MLRNRWLAGQLPALLRKRRRRRPRRRTPCRCRLDPAPGQAGTRLFVYQRVYPPGNRLRSWAANSPPRRCRDRRRPGVRRYSAVGIRGAVSALLFDFDGTIVETSHLWADATRRCFAARGFEVDEFVLASLVTTPWPDALPGLTPSDALAIEADIIAAIRPAYLECPR